VLSLTSVGLKSVAGPLRNRTDDFHDGRVEQQLQQVLRSEGFATSLRRLKIQSSIVYARRGDCRLSVRDARTGASTASIFANDARPIGPVRYLYDGRSYASPPSIPVRLGFIKAELLYPFSVAPVRHLPVALATSRKCGNGNFGLEDILVAS
jgi:hypothetical protein